MMVVGQEAAGKSALCAALLGCSCPDQEVLAPPIYRPLSSGYNILYHLYYSVCHDYRLTDAQHYPYTIYTIGYVLQG